MVVGWLLVAAACIVPSSDPPEPVGAPQAAQAEPAADESDGDRSDAPVVAHAPATFPPDVPAVPPAVALPPGSADLRVVDFGPQQQRATLALEVGPDDASALLTLTAPSPDAIVGFRQVTDPSGQIRYRVDFSSETVLVSDITPTILADAGGIALFLPVGPRQPLLPGTWLVDVVGNDGIDRAQALLRRGPIDGPGTLDLAVWALAGRAATDPDRVAAQLTAAADAVLAPHGLAGGNIRVVAAARADADRYGRLALDELGTQLHDACTEAVAVLAPQREAVVLLVDELRAGLQTAVHGPGGGPLRGFAAAAPGSAIVGAPSRSCAAAVLHDDLTATGRVALHEVAHLMGLVTHTSERDGLSFDLLADTPECPAERDANGDGLVTRAECTGLDADNLMFWEDGGSQLTADQAWVLRRHPLVRPATRRR